MARKFSEDALRNPVVITEKQIQEAEKAISTWATVEPLFKTPGWQIFIDHVRVIHDRLDKLSNCGYANYTKLIYQSGEVAGIKRFLDIPQTLQKKATSASELLELGLAEDKE